MTTPRPSDAFEVVVTGVSDKPSYTKTGYRTGEVGLTYGYWVPSKQQFVTVGQGLIVGKRADLEQHIGKVAEMKCGGVMPSGALRHHVFVKWRLDKDPKSVTLEEAVAA